MGTQPPPKKEAKPGGEFSAHVHCGQTAGWIKMAVGMEVGLGRVHIVLDGDTAPLPQFSAHLYCGQTAAWINMPLGTEVGLGIRNIVFDVDPATPRNKAHPPYPILAHVYRRQMAG